MTNSAPLKWHGGKSYLAARIIALMPPHARYVEPYFGGGAVLFRKPCDGIAEFANDANGDLTNFWRVLQRPELFDRFVRTVDVVPLSEAEWTTSRGPTGADASDVERAVRFFVRFRQSRQGLGRDYCTPTRRLRRGMNENVSAWLSAVDGLPEAHARLRRVEIWNRPALECVGRLDSPGTLFYADPPYLHETRSSIGEYGDHEMNESDHRKLLETLAGIDGAFLLSGYRSELYDQFAERCGWTRHEFLIDNKASSRRSKDKRIECVWANRGDD